MTYKVFKHSPPRIYSQRWRQLEILEIGEAFIVPWKDLINYKNPHASVSTATTNYGRKLNRKFTTNKHKDGYLVYRKE